MVSLTHAKLYCCEDISKVLASYKEYKLNGGTMKWNSFQKYYKEEFK